MTSPDLPPVDFLLCETPAMTFFRATPDKGRAIIASTGQDPSGEHGTWAGAAVVAQWILSAGASFRTVTLDDLTA